MSTILAKLGISQAWSDAGDGNQNCGNRIQKAIANWPQRLPEALYYYNVKEHSSTGVSPYKLMYVADPNSWVDEQIKEIAQGGPVSDSESVHMTSGTEEMEEEWRHMEGVRKTIDRFAERKQRQRNQKNKKSYDKKRNVAAQHFKVGDKVWKKSLQYSRKFAEGRMMPRWEGPFTVVKVTMSTAHIQRGEQPVRKGVRFELLKKK